MKKLLGILLASFFAVSAHAQTGSLQSGQVWGNPKATAAPATGTTLAAILNLQSGCSTRGSIYTRGASAWSCLSPSAVTRAPLLSGGTGADIAYSGVAYPASATSGGVAYFSSTTAMASSALLTANGFMIGGGAGAAPSTVTITGLVLGNGASAPTAYGGVSCTNQFLRALSASGASTCATVSLVNDITGTLPVGNGGTGQTTSLAARSSSGLNIDEATSTGDANYTILASDRMVYHTALTAARTDTLPAANSVNAGQVFYITDFRGVASGSNTITLQRAGSDTINGANSVVAISAQYGAGIFWSDGSSRWTYQPTSSGGGGGTVTQVVCNGVTITSSGTCPPEQGFSNISILGSVSGNNLTIAIKDNAGNDCSSASACSVWYRDFTTAANGKWTQVVTTSALSFTAAAGSTFGVANSTSSCLSGLSCPFKLWVVMINSGAGNVIGLANLTNVFGVRTFAINEASVKSSTACSSCATATSIATIYSTAAQTSKAIKIIGYCEWGTGLGTAGTYASAPTSCQTLGPGVKKPGETVQSNYNFVVSSPTTVTSTTFTSALSVSITPSMASNLIKIRSSGSVLNTNGLTSGSVGIANGTTIIGATSRLYNQNSNAIVSVGGQISYDIPGATSVQNYFWQVRGDGSINPGGLCNFGIATDGCTLEAEEIQG